LKVTFHAGAWGSDHLFQALNAIASAGFRSVEVYADVASVYEGKADEFLFFLQKAGLTLAGAYGGGVFTDPDFRDFDEEGARNVSRWIREAGGENLILQGGEPTGDTRRDLQVAASIANFIGGACRQEGIAFSYQPHIGNVVFREPEIRSFFSMTHPDNVGLCLDTGHLAEAGVGIVPLVVEFASRIRVVHLRDLRRKPVFVGGPFASAGKGTVPLPAIMAALRAQGYDGWIVGFAEDPREDPAVGAANFAAYATGKLHLTLD